MRNKTEPLLTRKGSENAPPLPLLKQPRCWGGTGRDLRGQRGSETKNNPQEKHSKDCAERGQTSPEAPLQPVPCFSRRRTQLCCCTISPVWIFGHFLSLPDTKTVGGCWPRWATGGRMGTGGCISACTGVHQEHPAGSQLGAGNGLKALQSS